MVRSRYSDEALRLADHALRILAAGEYGATALFGAVAAALVFHGCPNDLVSEAAKIPADEIRHADYVARMLALVRGKELTSSDIEVDVGVLRQRCVKPATLNDLDLFMLELPAISETIAAAMLNESAAIARDPVVRAVYRNIVRDEVHHGRLGWYYLAWRAPQWTRAEQQRVADRAGELVATIEERFSGGRDAPPGHAEAARALGVLDTAAQTETIRHLMEVEMVPALDGLGLGASHAWRVRRRFQPRRAARTW